MMPLLSVIGNPFADNQKCRLIVFFNSEIFYSFVIKITMLWQCKNIARTRLKSFKFTQATNIDLQNITLAIFQKLDYLTRKNAK